jgi:hypothetical protein
MSIDQPHRIPVHDGQGAMMEFEQRARTSPGAPAGGWGARMARPPGDSIPRLEKQSPPGCAQRKSENCIIAPLHRGVALRRGFNCPPAR